MFTTPSNNPQFCPKPLNSLQSKRESFHHSRVIGERDKHRKTIRFDMLSNELFQSINQSDFDFLMEKNIQEIQHILRTYIAKQNSLGLACSVIKLQQREESAYILNQEMQRDIVSYSQNIIHQPQIIAIYRCLSSNMSSFYDTVFSHPCVIPNITKQIQALKNSPSQQLYMQVLENLIQHYSKRYAHQVNELAELILHMLENQTVNFYWGVKVLKYISPFLGNDTQFPPAIVQRLILSYQNQADIIQSNRSESNGKGNSSVSGQLIRDIFIILIKVIYYQESTDIVTSWRLICVVLHAKVSLPSKMIEQYYDAFNLLSKIVQKATRYEIEEISSKELKETPQQLRNIFGFRQIDLPNRIHMISSMLVDQLLLENRHLLELKQFSESYLNLMVTLTKCCQPSVIFEHFRQSEFFKFLTECVQHLSMEVRGLALEIIEMLLQNSSQNPNILVTLKDYENLGEILEHLLLECHNPVIQKKINFIMERLDG